MTYWNLIHRLICDNSGRMSGESVRYISPECLFMFFRMTTCFLKWRIWREEMWDVALMDRRPKAGVHCDRFASRRPSWSIYYPRGRLSWSRIPHLFTDQSLVPWPEERWMWRERPASRVGATKCVISLQCPMSPTQDVVQELIVPCVSGRVRKSLKDEWILTLKNMNCLMERKLLPGVPAAVWICTRIGLRHITSLHIDTGGFHVAQWQT